MCTPWVRRRSEATWWTVPLPTTVRFGSAPVAHLGSGCNGYGCVHLTHCAAQTLYDTLHVGDEVRVIG